MLAAAGGMLASRALRSQPADVSGGPFDVAIIGAGAAGISAAHALRDSGKTFVILEARDRVGGRAFSDNVNIPGVPVDLGAEWFMLTDPIPGSDRTANPLYDMAKARSKELGIVRDNFRRTFFDLNSPDLPPPQRLIPALLQAAQLQASILTYGSMMQANPALPDISVDDLAELGGLRSNPWYQFAASPILNEHGAAMSKLSVFDLFVLMAEGPTVGGHLIQSGLGNFVGSLADGLPIALNTPVTSIQWRGGGVQLQTPSGTVQAKTVVVTTPVGVLASGKPSFDPVLPTQYTDAFAKLPMGIVEKIWLSYSEDIFGVEDINVVGEQLIGTSPGYQFHWFGTNVIAVIIGGDVAEAAARNGRQNQIDYARQAVAAAFGSSTLNKYKSAAVSQWTVDPYSQGAYTYAVPGGFGARAALGDLEMARSMFGGRIFFAGEAATPVHHSSLIGAWNTGQAAAKAALAAV
jgi:monoamine oxidase